MVVRHHGRPIKLDLDCSETLRCPLLSFSHPSDAAAASMDGVENNRDPHCSTEFGEAGEEEEGPEQVPAEMADDVVNIEPSDGGGREEQQQDGMASKDTDDKLDSGGSNLASIARRRADASRRSKSADEKMEPVSDEIAATPDSDRIGQDSQRESSGSSHEQLSQEKHQPDRFRHFHHQDPHQQHHGDLAPARLVAVLVDGSGKGWMAARRLWSVGQVGFNAMTEAGLTAADVDLEQEVGLNSSPVPKERRQDVQLHQLDAWVFSFREPGEAKQSRTLRIV